MYMRARRSRPGISPRMPIWFGRVSVSHTLTVAQRLGARARAGGRRGRQRGEERRSSRIIERVRIC